MRAPVSTYRLQLQPAFGFRAARETLSYLRALGVTDVYTSPLFAAEPGSTHGYNLIDPNRLNPELGSVEDFEAFTATLRELGLGLVLDWVPNHMGIGTSLNAWWNDVLEHGPSSRYADFFDVDWRPPKESLHDRVLLPILGRQYGEALEAGEIRLARTGGSFVVRYYERDLPVRPKSLAPLLEEAVRRCDLDGADPKRQELESIARAIQMLPPTSSQAEADREVRAREKEVIRRRLGDLLEASSHLAAVLDGLIAEINGRPGDPASFDRLDALLREQNYRPSSWLVATEEINYRRFFDVHGLAAIRMEDPAVFAATHGLLLELVAAGTVTGLRLDHTDGLYDPARYFAALQDRLADAAGASQRDGGGRPFYVIAEKILEPDEALRRSWRIHGTTGYDFLAGATGLLVDGRAEAMLTRLYQRFTRQRAPYAQVVEEAKRTILRSSLSAELNVLARRLERIAEASRRSRDFTLISLTRALTETLVAFRVYRTYVQADGHREPDDEGLIRGAIARARRTAREIPSQVFSFLNDVLLLADGARDPADRAARVELALKFQQLTGPVTAKAVEDTAFYRYHRLVCLNEVGSDPGRFGTSPASLHKENAARARDWPLSLLATATHDTKRGEDVRARLAVLTEMPDVWRRAVARWSRLGRTHKTLLEGEPAPSRNDEYLFYQTVVGAFPLAYGPEVQASFAPRVGAYMQKAAKEAKRETSWTNPNAEYESALAAFVEAMLADLRYLADVRSFCDTLAPYGAVNGLAHVLLRLCAPGVSDTYQGSELWDLRLVDPDNRAPIDYAPLRAMLVDLQARQRDPAALARDLLAQYRTGAVKLYVLHVGLSARRLWPAVFRAGSYEPLDGPEHVFAFARRQTSELVVCAVPRLSFRLTQGRQPWPLGEAWGEETLRMPADGVYRHLFTGETFRVGTHLRLAALFATFPVALLTRAG